MALPKLKLAQFYDTIRRHWARVSIMVAPNDEQIGGNLNYISLCKFDLQTHNYTTVI